MSRWNATYLFGSVPLVAGMALIGWGAPLSRYLPGMALICAAYFWAHITGGGES